MELRFFTWQDDVQHFEEARKQSIDMQKLAS
jgi:hypothetical protein